jgi:hypothetical protein
VAHRLHGRFLSKVVRIAPGLNCQSHASFSEHNGDTQKTIDFMDYFLTSLYKNTLRHKNLSDFF